MKSALEASLADFGNLYFIIFLYYLLNHGLGIKIAEQKGLFMTDHKNKNSHIHTKISRWRRFKNNLRNYFLAGVLILMPFGITLLVMQWLFGWMAGFLRPMLLKIAALIARNPQLATSPQLHLNMLASVLSVILLLVLVYFAGVIAQRVLGKKLIRLGEFLLLKIPVLRTIYGATKQAMTALSLPDKAAFRSVVLVEFPRPGMKALGFLTGFIEDSNGTKYCKVFIPTTPNPTTGFFEMIPVNEVVQTTLSVEEAFKMIISGGILSPEKLSIKNS